MDREDTEDTTIYKVVINREEQYSIWPDDRENPLGWNDAGKSGLKDECLEYIKEAWDRYAALEPTQEDGRKRSRNNLGLINNGLRIEVTKGALPAIGWKCPFLILLIWTVVLRLVRDSRRCLTPDYFLMLVALDFPVE